MTFAENTSVPIERSRAEIERLVAAAGATRFSSGWEADRAIIVFFLRERFVRFELAYPAPSDPRLQTKRNGRIVETSAAVLAQRLDQERRRLWRCLLLTIKAKCEAVSSGIVTFEQEFLSYVILPDGRTVADAAAPMIAEAYATGKTPLLLGDGRDGRTDQRTPHRTPLSDGVD